MDVLELGAPLYVPANRRDLADIGNGSIPGVHTVIFCTEDSLLPQEVGPALHTLSAALRHCGGIPGKGGVPYRFIRPRNPEILRCLLEMEHIDAVQGFVLPKIDAATLDRWLPVLRAAPEHLLMPTLESADVFDPDRMRRLRDILYASPLRERIVALRFGGLDLLNLLGLRRSPRMTLYDTPVGHYLKQAIGVFVPAGFALAAPAFECFKASEVLARELELDVLHGLYAKTAVHPCQLKDIHAAYRVAPEDLKMARALLDPEMPAVFRMADRMCEKATHIGWARRILLRAERYGLHGVAEQVAPGQRRRGPARVIPFSEMRQGPSDGLARLVLDEK